jgi:hypothetical protein
MTSSSTTIKAVSPVNGDGPAGSPEPGFGRAQLHEQEALSLISLVCEAQHQASGVSNELHKLIYEAWESASRSCVERLITETQACLQAADHYLLMLGSVNDERDCGIPAAADQDGDPDEPPF